MNASTKAAIAAIFASVAGAASAQSSVTLYGDIDQYVNYMHAGNGQKIISIDDGGLLRSRWGIKGSEDLGDGYAAKFQAEGGFSADSGTNSGTTTGTSSSVFDRQTWLGLSTPWGELRIGRQNTPGQARGGYIDYTARDLGSVVNEFAVPSRYDNDVSFISKRYAGLLVELHAALPEATNSTFGGTGSGVSSRAVVYNWAVDYLTKDVALGYVGTLARPSAKTAATLAPAYFGKNVQYHLAYADWFYGRGTVYATFVHSNDINPATPATGTASAAAPVPGPALPNSGGNGIAGNQYSNGTTPAHFYNVYQFSADYLLLPSLRIGGLWGKIDDTAHLKRGATGASVGAYWDVSKRSTIYTIVQQTRNQSNAAYRENGSGNLKTQFSAADTQGKTINGAAVGFLVRF